MNFVFSMMNDMGGDNAADAGSEAQTKEEKEGVSWTKDAEVAKEAEEPQSQREEPSQQRQTRPGYVASRPLRDAMLQQPHCCRDDTTIKHRTPDII